MDAGLHLGVPEADYHRDVAPEPSLSSSLARVLIDQSPAHARHAHPKLNPNWKPDEPSREQAFGSAVHALLLEGAAGVARCAIIDAPDYKTKAAREARDAAYAKNLIPILADLFVQANCVVDAARSRIDRTELRGVLDDGGDAEVTLLWQEATQDGNVWCRARPDRLTKDRRICLDLKTRGTTAAPDPFTRAIVTEGYALQAALYRRGVRATTGVDCAFVFIAVEIDPPYGLSLVGLTPSAMALADRKVQWCIDTWGRCLKTNQWDGYPSRICWVDTPAWDEAAWMAKELNNGDALSASGT